jgi:hypothetical protein
MVPTHSKMDLKTINQQDFVLFDTEKTQSARYEKQDNSGVLKFAGVSQYKSEYPNWGHYEFISIRSSRPVVGNSVKLDSTTTYKQNFSHTGEQTAPINRRKINISNPLTLGSTHFPETTAGAAFKPFKKHHFPERAEKKDFGIVPLNSIPETYKSMYSAEFSLKETPRLIQKKRESLLSPVSHP